ncbi:hypothetical protein FH972_014036 [Carpinus fangiana]|uniref:Uncharacterized protein n=1 Tax=Carpinus fangiana TaxID=176857 RepID=A0A5N6RB68_9ROSI|nr:hypothetical protein FH972_014036 [Carpinus fangiana]
MANMEELSPLIWAVIWLASVGFCYLSLVSFGHHLFYGHSMNLTLYQALLPFCTLAYLSLYAGYLKKRLAAWFVQENQLSPSGKLFCKVSRALNPRMLEILGSFFRMRGEMPVPVIPYRRAFHWGKADFPAQTTLQAFSSDSLRKETGKPVYRTSLLRVGIVPLSNTIRSVSVQSFEQLIILAVIKEDTETYSSRAMDFAPTLSRKQRQKVNVYNQVLHRLKDLSFAETNLLGFDDELWAHFHRLPTRYALDVNAVRAQDVLMHKRLLHMACDLATRHAIEVRVVEVIYTRNCAWIKNSWLYAFFF